MIANRLLGDTYMFCDLVVTQSGTRRMGRAAPTARSLSALVRPSPES
jgi:hypothetical protein